MTRYSMKKPVVPARPTGRISSFQIYVDTKDRLETNRPRLTLLVLVRFIACGHAKQDTHCILFITINSSAITFYPTYMYKRHKIE